jgi:PAS domain S-box-containing protein
MKPQQDAHDDPIAKAKLIADQREANARMVGLTIRAQERTEEARVAQARAEATAAELRESEERYRTLFDLAPVAVYSCDASGVIQKFNRHAAALWGREPALGDTDERFCGSFKMFRRDGTFMAHDACPMAEVVAGKVEEVRDAEVLFQRPDGSRVTVVVNIRPVKNEAGEITTVINCFYDITARKEAENRLVDTLNRERELAEFRETFIGILGHDLRNPLGAIIMASRFLLARGALTEENERLVSRMLNSGQRMSRMIGQIVEFTRVRLGGGLELKLAPCNLGEVCRETADELRMSSSVEIQQTVEGDVAGTWDADRLAQAVSNIAGNAVEYATPGTPVLIHVRGDGAAVVAEITNQGDAIPADLLPVIFKPFRRAKGNEGNTVNLGLGLYVAAEVVRSHGGTLDVRSSDAITTFTLRLPRTANALPSSGARAVD